MKNSSQQQNYFIYLYYIRRKRMYVFTLLTLKLVTEKYVTPQEHHKLNILHPRLSLLFCLIVSFSSPYPSWSPLNFPVFSHNSSSVQ